MLICHAVRLFSGARVEHFGMCCLFSMWKYAGSDAEISSVVLTRDGGILRRSQVPVPSSEAELGEFKKNLCANVGIHCGRSWPGNAAVS